MGTQKEQDQPHPVKTISSIPSVSSLNPGISATLPDDFLDTGDSDSDKSPPQPDQKIGSSSESDKESKSSNKDTQEKQINVNKKLDNAVRSSSRAKTSRNNINETVTNKDNSNKKGNEKEELRKPSRTGNARKSTKEIT